MEFSSIISKAIRGDVRAWGVTTVQACSGHLYCYVVIEKGSSQHSLQVAVLLGRLWFARLLSATAASSVSS
jgi:hypothetical protein